MRSGGMSVLTGWLKLKWAPVLLALVSVLALAEQTVEVRIEKYAFTPQAVSIRVGDSVTWVNREKRTSHSIILPIAGVSESERLFPDERWTYRFEQPGRYDYHCGPHPEMKGLVVVSE